MFKGNLRMSCFEFYSIFVCHLWHVVNKILRYKIRFKFVIFINYIKDVFIKIKNSQFCKKVNKSNSCMPFYENFVIVKKCLNEKLVKLYKH